MKTIRILQMSSALDGGGVERLLFDYYKNMDYKIINCDFTTVQERQGILEDSLKQMGSQIFRLPRIRAGYKEYQAKLTDIFNQNQYDIIHSHLGYKSWFALQAAKEAGIPVRIAHSHTSNNPERHSMLALRKMATQFTKYYATHLFACGEDAAIWMWGKKTYNNGNIHIMTNAIDTKRFRYSTEKRNEIRRSLGLNDKFVIGNVGRFSYAKNHEFMIKAFADIKKNRNNAILMLVGRGELEEDVKKQVSLFGLNDSVIFMGVRNDVPDLINAMDVFILPSRFEGLPVTLVEVQANGLYALASEVITKEVTISDRINYLPLDVSIWNKTLLSLHDYNNLKDREKYADVVRQSGYDICKAAYSMQNTYTSLYQSSHIGVKNKEE